MLVRVRHATEARRSLAFRKSTQPLALPSAGCVFQNPDAASVRLPAGLPASAGALVDAAGLKGAACGHCYTAVPIHRRQEIQGGRGVTACEGCGVLVYDPGP